MDISLDCDLVIIQNRETQFDAPLYECIQRENAFSLQVIYTEPPKDGASIDVELGFSPSWDHLQPDGYSCSQLRNTHIGTLLSLARQIKAWRPRLVVICGYYPRSQLLLAVLLRAHGVRIGLRSDNTLSHTDLRGLRGIVRRLGAGSIQRLFHTWHPVGEQALAYLRCLSGVERPSFRFAYAVDNDWFATQSEQARAQRLDFQRRIDWPDDACVVLGILKWTAREDPLTLVRAFAMLCHERPRLRLILIGDGPLRDAVETACAPLQGLVCRPGFQPYSQLPIWYGRADLFVHPSPDEPWGVSVNEALACNVPVIAAEGVGAAHELITPGSNGALFCNGDAAALAAEITAMIPDTAIKSQRADACSHAADSWHYRHTLAAFQRAMAPSPSTESDYSALL